MVYAFLALCVALEAVQQGILLFAITEFVPESYKGIKLSKYTGFALHFLGVASYLVVAAYVAVNADVLLSYNFWIVALLLRVLTFDVSVNLTRNYMNSLFGVERIPLFSVGTSSVTDHAIQSVAKRLHLNASILSAGVRIAAAVALFFLI